MKNFKAESKKIMDLMINSIYTNKEIFLRELISNASDAIDKLYYEALQKGESGFNRNDFSIILEIDKENRILKISDNGIGMNKEQLEDNLGVIAKSGSQLFKENLEKNPEIDIIGQFGVGFYSAFMVAKKIEVISKAYGEEFAYVWSSQGSEGYDIKPSKKETLGTEIILYLKDNTENDNYDEFLEEYTLRHLIKKYSDYIRYAIKLKTKKTENEKEVENFETLNSMVPLWKKNKREISEEEYNKFYKDMFNSLEEPISHIHLNLEGKVDFKALLFIPKNIPYGYYSKEYEKGLKLYTSGVMITEKCQELLPDYFNFVKGIVDAELQLNISRETLQQSRELISIANTIEEKVKNALLEMQKESRDKYIEFFKEFGLQFKYSIYKEWGMNKDKLQDLLLYYSCKQDKYITLNEYIEAMPENQESIYYAFGENVDSVKALPQVDGLNDKGFDVLCMKDEIDEFVIKMIMNYKNKIFVNALSQNISNEDKIEEEYKELMEYLNEISKDEVEKVKLNSNLKNHPVCLSSEGEISLEMERAINANPANPNKVHANKILEINSSNDIFEKIKNLFNTDKEKLKDLMFILINQAKLIAGLPIEKPAILTQKICELIK